MTSSLLHSVPPCLHGTAEGLAAGDAVTVADSGLIGTPALRGPRRMGTQTRRASPITGSGRLPQLDLALGTRHRAGGPDDAADPVAAAGRHHAKRRRRSRDRCFLYQSATDPAGG